MNKFWKAVTIITVLIFISLLFVPTKGKSEEGNPVKVYVTAKLLNGRAKPSKNSMVEAVFDFGDALECWQWSEKHHWVEVTGGETGTVWVCWKYVTERLGESTWWNSSGKKVKIRKEPFGTVIGYLKAEGEVVIDQIILGWGHCSRGWIDMSYLDEEL